MILLPLAMLSMQGSVIEIQKPTAKHVTIQAVCKLPPLDPLGRAAVDLLAKTLTNDNDHFSKAEMTAICVPGGEPRASAMPDHIWMRLSVLRADAAAGVRMMAAIVRTARITPEKVGELLETEPYKTRSIWSRALDSAPRAWTQLKHADVETMRLLVMRPENVTVAVGGPIVPVAAQIVWTEATEDWQVSKRPRPLRPVRDSVAPPSQRSGETAVIEFAGREWHRGEDSAPRLLSLVALGSGKGSSLFRIAREQMGASYRQEAALYPSQGGLVPRLLIQAKADGVEQETATAIKTAILKDIESWNDATLARAVGHAKASLGGGLMNPFYLHANTTIGPGFEDEVFMAAYWNAKTGGTWNPAAIAEQFETVTVEQLRSTARSFLDAAELVIHD